MYKHFKIYFLIIISLFSFFANAEEVLNLDSESLRARSEISITPQRATFTEGAIFEVPILLNTKGRSVNTVDVYISYDPNKLLIVKPSTGKSIISLWIQPPSYDNAKGLAHIVGSIPNGIVSDSSLLLSITFQAKAIGQADVRILDSSTVLANDGLGTPTILSFNRASYNILPKPQGAVFVYSDTHSFQDHWYNNNSPVIAWNKEVDVVGYSYVIDEKPNTIPENINITTDLTKAYQDLKDGLWYFHIKSLKNPNLWGSTTNFLLRIDTTPPAQFKPKINYITNENTNRALITFFTTDSLSGIDHYEIGIIDTKQKDITAPLFVRTESPYEMPQISLEGSIVVVRAYDFAGNSTDAQVVVKIPSKWWNWVLNHETILLLILLGLFLLVYLAHYFWGHKVWRKLKLIFTLLGKKNDKNKKEVIKELEEIQKTE